MTQHQVIDVHAHMVPPPLVDRIRSQARSLPSVSLSTTADGRPLIALPRSAELGPARPPIPALLDLPLAVSRMDRQGVDLALISIWPDLLGTLLEPAESVVWATCVNDALIEVVDQQDRFRALATIPLQSDQAVAEMERAKKLGFIGVEIGTRALGHELDSAYLDQFWEAAARLEMPVFVHPLYYGGDDRLVDNRPYGLANSIGRVNDTTIAISKVLLSGVPVRYPELKIIVAHGGGGIPYLLGRLGNVHQLNPDYSDPYLGFAHLYFDSIVFDPKALEYLIARGGSDHVLLGSDHPFANGDPEPTKIVSRANLDAETRALVLGGNARRMFGL
jgi:aminocarboxymuconate-semialdehyde decarboxylase